MRENVQVFATSLLDHARTSQELEIMLNYNHEAGSNWDPGDRQTLDRLKLAIKYKQKAVNKSLDFYVFKNKRFYNLFSFFCCAKFNKLARSG